MRKIFLTSLLSVAGLGGLQAAIVPCTNTNISVLIAMGSGATNGCQVDDKLFNNFSYTAGAGAPVSTLVNSSLVANTIDFDLRLDLYFSKRVRSRGISHSDIQ